MKLSKLFSRALVEPFVVKPGMHLPAGTTRKALTVAERQQGRMAVDRFVQTKGAKAAHAVTGKQLDMTPVVSGGFREGDIVLRGNSAVTTAQSGMMTTLREGLETGEWHIRKSAVSHAGIVARMESGELKVIQMVSGDTPPELAKLLTPRQRKLKATFLREDSISDFFNLQGDKVSTASVVMRPNDPELGVAASRKALEYYRSQVTAAGTKPWYAKIPHSLAPDGRGGVCSTFVDLAYGKAFANRYHIPTTPLDFARSAHTTKVGERLVTDIQALGAAVPEGTVRLGR